MDEALSRLLQLLDEYGVRLHALLTRITLREDAAEELLQELFLKLRDAAGFKVAPAPEQYLFRTAINLAFDWRKRNQRSSGNAPLQGDESCPRPSPLEQAIQSEQLELVLSALEQLAESDRELIVMRYLHGESYEDLATRLRSTSHRVRALCSKAIARMRVFLERTDSWEVTDVSGRGL